MYTQKVYYTCTCTYGHNECENGLYDVGRLGAGVVGVPHDDANEVVEEEVCSLGGQEGEAPQQHVEGLQYAFL